MKKKLFICLIVVVLFFCSLKLLDFKLSFTEFYLEYGDSFDDITLKDFKEKSVRLPSTNKSYKLVFLLSKECRSCIEKLSLINRIEKIFSDDLLDTFIIWENKPALEQIDDMTAEENIQVPLGYAGISSKKRKEISDRLLERVGLKEKAKNKPSQLSGGQQQRIAIARALANHPTVLLADEPTGNLDYESGLEIMSLLKELNRYGMTIVMVTHDLNLASYADTHINMIDGKLVEK